ncbi:hypothetical protein K438DRAFT_2025322 [Mycena galopus ATCC 62051]|nr:hypothetical protein K438DRAFT_2025322 [Mycena galopus ATCC 62051]
MGPPTVRYTGNLEWQAHFIVISIVIVFAAPRASASAICARSTTLTLLDGIRESGEDPGEGAGWYSTVELAWGSFNAGSVDRFPFPSPRTRIKCIRRRVFALMCIVLQSPMENPGSPSSEVNSPSRNYHSFSSSHRRTGLFRGPVSIIRSWTLFAEGAPASASSARGTLWITNRVPYPQPAERWLTLASSRSKARLRSSVTNESAGGQVDPVPPPRSMHTPGNRTVRPGADAPRALIGIGTGARAWASRRRTAPLSVCSRASGSPGVCLVSSVCEVQSRVFVLGFAALSPNPIPPHPGFASCVFVSIPPPKAHPKSCLMPRLKARLLLRYDTI